MLEAAHAPVAADQRLAQAQAGDQAAFAEIVREHQAMVFSLALRCMRDRSAAEELAQEVFLELYRNLLHVDSAAHLVFWLRRVTSHRCIDRVRREGHRVELAMDGGLKGVYVKSFEFEREGAYTDADLETVLKQLKAPGWSRIVDVKSKRDRETVAIYMWREGDQSGGLAIVAAEPKELTIVNIVGPIDLAKLGALQGRFGIPQLPLVPPGTPPQPPPPPRPSRSGP